MKLYQKPPDVTMKSVYEIIYELEMRIFGEAFYHAGSHRTDPLLSIGTPVRRGLRGEPIAENPHTYLRPTQCPKCRRVSKLLAIEDAAIMCRWCGYTVRVSTYDCETCGAKAGNCDHIVRGYIIGPFYKED